MSENISRRKFLENFGVGAAAGAGLLLTKEHARAEGARAMLPSRTLGRTEAKVSILAFGCGSRFLMYKDEESAAVILNRAIDSGITYLDTAFACEFQSRRPALGRAPHVRCVKRRTGVYGQAIGKLDTTYTLERLDR
jgi:hypothetical protein